MMAAKENGRLGQGDRFPNSVVSWREDNSEHTLSLHQIQASRLVRFAVSRAMARAIAPLVYGEVQQ